MIYLVLGYSIVWVLILGYTVLLHRQQHNMKKQILILEEEIKASV